MAVNLSPEIQYILLIFLLFVFPKILLRLHIPTAITSFMIGFAWASLLEVKDDPVIKLLSTFGIVSLFVFAGMEVDFSEVNRNKKFIGQYIAVRLLVLLLLGLGVAYCFSIDYRPAIILSLALITPSTGFILDSIEMMGLSPNEAFWIKSKAISMELIAIAIMFITLQATSWTNLALSTLAILILIAVLPFLLSLFIKIIVPIAPRSEFAFLMMLALICAIFTRKMGAYYLVGAFIVGLVSQRFRKLLPHVNFETILHSFKSFSSFFIPFYFFHAAEVLTRAGITKEGALLGFGFIVVLVPLRLSLTIFHRKFILKESMSASRPIALALLPNLVFGLVLAEILETEFHLNGSIIFAVLLYSLSVTLIPCFLLRGKGIKVLPETFPY